MKRIYQSIALACATLSLYLLVPVLARKKQIKLKPFEATTVRGMCAALNVDHAQAFQYYKRGLQGFVRLALEFFFNAKLNDSLLQKKLDCVAITGADYLSSQIELNRPILIVTMYMGNFPLGFLKLLKGIRYHKKVFVFKVNAKNKREEMLFDFFRRTGQNIEPIRAGEEGGKKAFLELRKGNVVAMMIDAEVHVKTRETVQFLNHQCGMQSGPATLAVLSKASIVPVITYLDSNGQVAVRVDAPLFTTPQTPGETQQQIISRLTQAMATQMETWVRMHPAQVQRWSSLVQIINTPAHETSQPA